MNEPKIIIPDATGLVGREKNPYQHTPEMWQCKQWFDFEDSVQSHPLTSYQEPSKEVEAVLVWQEQLPFYKDHEWDNCAIVNSVVIKTDGCNYRQAWQPIKQADKDLTSVVAMAGTQMNEDQKRVEAKFYEWEKSLKHGYGRVEIWSAAYKQAHSDPAFICEIVRQTLEYVAGRFKPRTGEIITGMHPEIVNQIINKK